MTDTIDDAPPTTSKSSADRTAAVADIGLDDGVAVAKSVTINRPARELYDYWRNFAQLPAFMDNVERIDVASADRSHWVVKAPGGKTVEWDAIVTEDRPGELIAWASAEGADVPNAGRVEFREAGGRGTVVTATIAYDPPAGLIGRIVAKMFQREPAIQARRDLRRFKQLMEAGEVATAAMNPNQLAEEQA